MPPIASAPHRSLLLILAFVSATAAQDDAPAESPQVRLLKAGRVPEPRQGAIVEMIARRGKPADLGYLFDRALRTDGFSAPVRLKTLESLAEAALTRKVRPEGDLARLKTLLDDPALRPAAIRLAGIWKVEPLAGTILALARDPSTSSADRSLSLEALADMGDAQKASLDALSKAGSPEARASAVAAMARLDPALAADRAVDVLREAAKGQDFAPMLAPFLNSRDGAEKLAAAIVRAKVPADPAKLALRAVFALGRSDAGLVDALSQAAGISSEVKPPDKAEMDRLLAEVGAHGDAARGEQVFRRADLNCIKCHAVAGAAGGVGPELSAIGASSPVDYLVYSIMVPDQSIKEEFVTKVVATADGRAYQGIVVDKDDKRLVLREATGETRVIPADDVDEIKDGGSLMPKGLVNFMTRAELVDLLKFLTELGKPGPYAIHSNASPTVQRWRVLKPSSTAVESDPDRWVPLYAYVPGTLPMGELSEAGGPVATLQAEVNVTAEGPIAFRLNSAEGVRARVDDKPAGPGEAFEVSLAPGVHKLRLLVDTKTRAGVPLKVEVSKPSGSPAEFSVVGGR